MSAIDLSFESNSAPISSQKPWNPFMESRLVASYGPQIASGGTDFLNPATICRIKATRNAENIWSDKPSAR